MPNETLSQTAGTRHSPIQRALTGPGTLLISAVGRRLRCGRLTVVFPDGRRATYAGERPGTNAILALSRWRAVRRLLVGGKLGFAEAYVDGDWDSPDLASLIELGSRNEFNLGGAFRALAPVRWAHRLAHVGRPNSKGGSRNNIAAHYDLGNAFYAQWLDRTMTYSAAMFDRPDQPLEEAQQAKYRHLARMLDLHPAHHVLEIGCGWGGFAIHAAREMGCRVTAITISAQQYEEARARVHKAGLSDRVTVRFQDYRDVEGTFDRVVAIEMFEAVGEAYWPVFFDRLRARLAPGGLAGLQVISIDDGRFAAYRRGADFIQRYVFPGGMLPSPTALRESAAAAGLRTSADDAFGADYGRTLAIWHRNFQRAWPDIADQGFDDRFRRLWTYYLAYCEAGFRSGAIDVHQVRLEPV